MARKARLNNLEKKLIAKFPDIVNSQKFPDLGKISFP